MTPAGEDHAAMARLRAGEDLALNGIMERWQRRVTGFLVRMTGNETIALDLAQETFVRVYLSRERFRPQGEFSTWLFAIAANLGRQHFRWQRRHPTVSFDDPNRDEGSLVKKLSAAAPDAVQTLVADERTMSIRDAVMALPTELREAVILSEYENLSHRQIAEIAGCTPKAVETRLYRARSILRERLAALLA
ncbi:MAG: sigma-70 family RNA polymerase sigma factor [Terrimicrobiaceae bacterium]|nr:sigma-70 family RNA polymerase sigma factor [Terrimicrobiaceae bacterium]